MSRHDDNTPRWTTTAPPRRDASLDPHHVTETVPADYRSIKGWGVDLDPKDRPMYPMELPSDVTDVRGEVNAWQVPSMDVYVSIEHPNRTPVFGETCPPRGLSGVLRNYAYRYGEGTNRHWMTLILADRIDVLENLVGDTLRGRPDHYIEEKGWKANFKYDDERGTNYVAVGVTLIGAIAVGALLRRALSGR